LSPASRAPVCAVALVLFGASCTPRDGGAPPPAHPIGGTHETSPSGPLPAGGGPGSSMGPAQPGAAQQQGSDPSGAGQAGVGPAGTEALPPDVDHGPEPQAALPPEVKFGEPKFTSGDVPDVASSLNKHRGDIAQCVASHGGLTASSGSLEVQFLVRARGKAEGVGVNRRKAVSEDAGKCIRDLLKNKRVGAPSEDPVGVTVVIDLKEASGS